MRLPPEGTTRRIITDFFKLHRSLVMPPVLELGSARPAAAWWADIRQQLGGIAREDWLGVDIKPSECTDVVHDLTRGLDGFPLDRHGFGFGSCVAAEVLEHVDYPGVLLKQTAKLLRRGAWIVITSPFAFPVHESTGHDYWRFTPRGLRLLLTDAGFEQAQAWELASSPFGWIDHEISPTDTHDADLPMWVGAIARRPE